MNFYPHHIGDFNNATRHLTRVERSVYRDAIELYYDTESPLDSDVDRLCRKLICNSEHERDALISVLNEFFVKSEIGFFHERCSIEINKYHANTSAKARAGIASAEKRKQNSTSVQQNSASVQQNSASVHNQEPLTNNQEPLKPNSKDLSAPSASTSKKGTRLSPDWFLPKEWGEFALAEKPVWSADDVRRVAADFKDHFISTPGAKAVKLDWMATWRKWVRSPLNEVKPTSKGISRVQESRLDFMEQLFGGKNGNDSKVIDITEVGTIEGNGTYLQEVGDGIWESDGG